MKELLLVGGALIVCLGIAASGPLVALAEMSHVEPSIQEKCGLQCVIETVAFDTKDEADDWFEEHKAYKRTAPYQLKSAPYKWFVDYQVSEAEAEGVME